MLRPEGGSHRQHRVSIVYESTPSASFFFADVEIPPRNDENLGISSALQGGLIKVVVVSAYYVYVWLPYSTSGPSGAR